MDMNTIVSLIGSLGFPIVCCIIMFRSIEKERETNSTQRELDRQEHKEEMQKITEALQNNTIVMQKLTDTLTFNDSTGKHV